LIKKKYTVLININSKYGLVLVLNFSIIYKYVLKK